MQEISLQWCFDINIHVQCSESTIKLTSCDNKQNLKKRLNEKVNLNSDQRLLALIYVWVEGVLMGLLGIPPLAGDAWRGLVDSPAVILPAPTETLGGEAGALALLYVNFSWREGTG